MTDGKDRSDQAFAAWQETVSKRAENMAKGPAIDWANKKLDPKDLGVEMGPILTEEQFKEYCRTSGTAHTVLKVKK